MNGLLARVRSQLTVILYSPDTSGSRSCDGDSNSLSHIRLVLLIFFRSVNYWATRMHALNHSLTHSLTRARTHTHTHTHTLSHTPCEQSG